MECTVFCAICMANVNVISGFYASTGKHLLAASVILLSAIVVVIVYWALDVKSFPPHVGHQECFWTKQKTKISRQNENPPWFSLLADYDRTVRSGRNLYV